METLHSHTSASTYGIILCLFGLLFCYIIAMRRFNRRGIGGLQQYNSYAEALITSTIERIVKLIGIAAIVVGAILLLTDSPKQKAQPNKKQINNEIKQHSDGN